MRDNFAELLCRHRRTPAHRAYPTALSRAGAQGFLRAGSPFRVPAPSRNARMRRRGCRQEGLDLLTARHGDSLQERRSLGPLHPHAAALAALRKSAAAALRRRGADGQTRIPRGVRGGHAQPLLQLGATAIGAFRLFLAAYQQLEIVLATATGVFVDRHRQTLAREAAQFKVRHGSSVTCRRGRGKDRLFRRCGRGRGQPFRQLVGLKLGSPAFQQLRCGVVPRLDAGLREQSAAEDDRRQRQHGEPLAQPGCQRNRRHVPCAGEQQEVRLHHGDAVRAQAATTTAMPTYG